MPVTRPTLPEPSSASTMGRAGLMELLYHAYGRDDPSHPQHSLYTGLAEQARSDIGNDVLEEAASRWQQGSGAITIPVRFER